MEQTRRATGENHEPDVVTTRAFGSVTQCRVQGIPTPSEVTCSEEGFEDGNRMTASGQMQNEKRITQIMGRSFGLLFVGTVQAESVHH